MNEQVLGPKTPEKKNLLKPSPKSPSRSSRKKSLSEDKYAEGVTSKLKYFNNKTARHQFDYDKPKKAKVPFKFSYRQSPFN